jgi:soluble lytic murein transglycosylase-like protein
MWADRLPSFFLPQQQQNPLMPDMQPFSPMRPSGQMTPFQNFGGNMAALDTGPDSAIPPEMDALYQRAAAMYGVPVEELRAIGYMESRHGRDKSISSAGAAGPMQLMPATAQEVGVTNRMDPMQNVMGAARYYAKLRRMFGGNVAHSLAAYNAGPGRIQNWLAGRGKPLAQETIDYMRKAPRMANYYRSI